MLVASILWAYERSHVPNERSKTERMIYLFGKVVHG